MAVRKNKAGGTRSTIGRRGFLTLAAITATGALAYVYKSGSLDGVLPPLDQGVEAQTPLQIQYAYFSPPQIRMPAELPSPIATGEAVLPIVEPTPEQSAADVSEAQRLNRLATLHAKTQSEYVPGTLPPATPTPEASTPQSPDAKQETSTAESGSRLEKQENGTQVAKITVKSGDNYTAIAQGLGIPSTDTALMLELPDVKKKLDRLIPGEQLIFELSDTGQLISLSYELDREHRLRARMQDGAFVAEKESLGLEKRLMQAAGHVENSIFLAASAAGVSDALIMNMAEIFRWDVDFAMDIQPGDTFKIVYEGLFEGDQLKRTGQVLAVELTSRQKTHKAFYYKREGYKGAFYTADGRSLEKQFLRNPMEVVRITSPFNLSRRHPVLNTIRAHKGVDYGAATGTPIFATGKGKVAFIGGKGGYGKTVILQHGRKYSTLYAHMSRFGKGLKLGDRVEQGQVIGYVGKTGLATGPHLHYEFRINGKHTDPQTVNFPGAESLPKSEFANFEQQSRQSRFALNALKLPTVALSD